MNDPTDSVKVIESDEYLFSDDSSEVHGDLLVIFKLPPDSCIV